MANGFAPYLLKTINEVATQDDPQYKITSTGFLKMLLASNVIRGAKVLNLNLPSGQKRQVFVKYQQRYSINSVQETDNCDIDVTPQYLESELQDPRVAKIGVYISYEDLRKFQEDAIQTVMVGQPATKFMRDHVEAIMRAANAIVGKIDTRLLGDVVWGTNVTTGTNAAVTVNINKNVTANDLETGLTKVLADAFENEMWGGLQIVGSGLFNNYELQKVAATAALSGIDVSKFSGYSFSPDLYAKAAWGTNQIGVFSEGAIGFVDLNKYVGSFEGKLGVSDLFQMTLPVATGQNDGTVPGLTFDVQLKPLDCPTELLNGYGEPTTYDKGYALFITKNYGLWQIPSDAYLTDDRLTGVNGALRYVVTNDCVECQQQ
jgi:hypothetical protein